MRVTNRRSEALAALPFIAGIGALLLYSHFLRPLWYDEMVYFVLGGLDSPKQLFAVLRETSSNINQGQTGVYQTLVWLSLKSFGASLLSLRIVSMLFGLLFIITSLIYLRRQGLNWSWQLIFVLLLSGSATLMLFVSEARVYISLVGLTTSALLYYSFDSTDRGRWIEAFGWITVLLLAVIQPYAALYLPLVIVFGWLTRRNKRVQRGIRGLVNWSNPLKIVVASLLYLVTALLTWLQGTASFSNDPWETISRPLPLEILQEHLLAVMTQRSTAIVWVWLILIAIVFVALRTRSAITATEVAPPIILFALSVAASLSISLLSLSQGFWILPRQWIASIALALIAFVWFLHSIWRLLKDTSPLLATSYQVAIALIALASVFSFAHFQASKWIISVRTIPETTFSSYTQQELSELILSGERLPEKEWIRFAQANAIQGGPVWQELGHYYLDRDWSDFEVVIDPMQLTVYD